MLGIGTPIRRGACCRDFLLSEVLVGCQVEGAMCKAVSCVCVCVWGGGGMCVCICVCVCMYVCLFMLLRLCACDCMRVCVRACEGSIAWDDGAFSHSCKVLRALLHVKVCLVCVRGGSFVWVCVEVNHHMGVATS